MEFENVEMRNINELARLLKEEEKVQNILRIDEFETYRPLFVSEIAKTLDYTKVKELSTQFIKRINPYKAVEVVDMNNRMIFKIPQIFVPIKDISNDYEELVARFRSEGSSEIPKYAAEATVGILHAILETQKDASKEEGYSSYGEYINKIRVEYQKDLTSFNEKKGRSENIEQDLSSLGISDAKEEVVIAQKDTKKNLDDVSIEDLGLSWK